MSLEFFASGTFSSQMIRMLNKFSKTESKRTKLDKLYFQNRLVHEGDFNR